MIGTFGSILGASIIGLAAYLLINAELKLIFGVILTAFLSALLDSLIGDTLQGKYKTNSGKVMEKMQLDTKLISGYRIVDNNLVNLVATLAGPFLMYIFIHLAT